MKDKILFDRPKLERLKAAYRVALKSGKETFRFEDREYLIAYAKYLIEYLETST